MIRKIPGLHFPSEESRQLSLGAYLLGGDEAKEKHARKNVYEDLVKLHVLAEHYGIQWDDPAMFYKLALTLARELYPEHKKRGRRSKWTVLNKGALVVEVERLVRPNDPSRGVEWACMQLAKTEPWTSFLEAKEGGTVGPDPAEALRQIYFQFRDDKWANMLRDNFRGHKLRNATAEWEKRVIDLVRNPHPK